MKASRKQGGSNSTRLNKSLMIYLRQLLGWNQEDLASKAGCNERTISNLETKGHGSSRIIYCVNQAIQNGIAADTSLSAGLTNVLTDIRLVDKQPVPTASMPKEPFISPVPVDALSDTRPSSVHPAAPKHPNNQAPPAQPLPAPSKNSTIVNGSSPLGKPLTIKPLRTLGEHNGSIRHTENINDLIVLADGRVISASADQTLIVWSIDDSEQPSPILLKGHTSFVNHVAAAPNGKIISASADKKLLVWDLETGQPKPLEGHKQAVNHVSICGNNRYAASGAADGIVAVWDLSELRSVFLQKIHNFPVNRVRLLGNNRVVSAGADGKVIISTFDFENGKLLERQIMAVEAVATCMRVLHTQEIITGGDDGKVWAWNIKSNNKKIVGEHKVPVKSIEITYDQKLVVSADEDGVIMVFDVQNCAQVGPTLRGHEGPINAIRLASVPQRCVSAGMDKKLRVWDLKNGQFTHVLEGHDAPVNCCVALHDGKRIVSGSYDGAIKVWQLEG
jgi:WD40 repeat protein/transcriptional regulator with XRE-family HTH domain